VGKEIYPYEIKLAVVKYVLEEGHSRKEAAQRYDVSCTVVEKWVNLYQNHGKEGLLSRNRRSQQQNFTGKFKLNVLEYMEENNLSYTQTAAIFCIDVVTVSRWARRYREEGAEALFKDNYGRNMLMTDKGDRRPSKAEGETGENLREEIERLRMENAYLKKLNALIQERVQRENGKK